METEGNIHSVTTNSDQQIRNLTVIQDFNNKKANSHATIFVASMFALFTVLSLATRIVAQASFSISNCTVLFFSSVSYILIWIFGLYSALNFSYYSTVSQRAEEAIVCGLDRQLISSYMEDWKGPLRRFANFKVPPDQGWFRKKLEWTIIIGYFVIGVLPFLAFLIWFLG